jgi:hypothetical protein
MSKTADLTVERYTACTEYLSDQTPENWERFLAKIVSDLGGVVVTLEEKNAEFPDREIKVRVECENLFLNIRPEGYGAPGIEDGYGSPVALEVYEGELRLLVTPDIMNEDVAVIPLEQAREQHRAIAEAIMEAFEEFQPTLGKEAKISWEGGEFVVRDMTEKAWYARELGGEGSVNGWKFYTERV